MSAISLILLTAATATAAVSGAALHTARGLHRRIDALRAQLDAVQAAGGIPSQGGSRSDDSAAGMSAARTAAFAEEIRTAVTQALAEERERELTEARAFWAAQEARDESTDDAALLSGRGTEFEIVPGVTGLDAALLDAILEGHSDEAGLEDLPDLRDWQGLSEGDVFVPRQNACEVEPSVDASCEAAAPENPTDPEGETAQGSTGTGTETGAGTGMDKGHAAGQGQGHGQGHGQDSSDLAAARRRHPSHPDFRLNGEPVVPAQSPTAPPTLADHERTVERLTELARARTPLSDVRQGPLGTLDVYLFDDGTTVCVSPGHRDTAERLCSALRDGNAPVLMGGSTISGAYALTFGYGQGQTVYLLADRVIASL